MASPTDLIKTQIQMEGRRRLLGYEARVEGAADALRFFSVGFQGFEHFSGKLWLKVVSWGCGGAAGQMCRFGKWLEVPFFILQLQRAALVNLGDLSTYDRWSNTTEGLEIPQIYLFLSSVKAALLENTSLEDNSLTHCMSSACAG